MSALRRCYARAGVATLALPWALVLVGANYDGAGDALVLLQALEAGVERLLGGAAQLGGRAFDCGRGGRLVAFFALMVLVEQGAGLIGGNTLGDHHGATLRVDHLIAWAYRFDRRGRLRRRSTQNAYARIGRGERLDLGAGAAAWRTTRGSSTGGAAYRLSALGRSRAAGAIGAAWRSGLAAIERGVSPAQTPSGVADHWLIVQDA